MIQKIFENESLQFIINSINLGIVEDDLDSLTIKSTKFENIIIRPIEINMLEYIKSMPKPETIKKAETSFIDYIVFKQNDDTLMLIGLLELISASGQNELGPFEFDINFSLTDKVWTLEFEENNIKENE